MARDHHSGARYIASRERCGHIAVEMWKMAPRKWVIRKQPGEDGTSAEKRRAGIWQRFDRPLYRSVLVQQLTADRPRSRMQAQERHHAIQGPREYDRIVVQQQQVFSGCMI